MTLYMYALCTTPAFYSKSYDFMNIIFTCKIFKNWDDIHAYFTSKYSSDVQHSIDTVVIPFFKFLPNFLIKYYLKQKICYILDRNLEYSSVDIEYIKN